MQIKGIRRLKKISKRLFLKTQSRAVILLYHRIENLDSDPQLLSVSPTKFAEHLKVIKDLYHPCSLSNLVVNLRKKQVKHNSVAITFDDGYSDNLHKAKPILTEYKIPATVFVTAGKVDRREEFWWDDLERLILRSKHLPEKICLSIRGKQYQWKLEKCSEIDRDWNVLNSENLTSRQKVYLDLCHLLRTLSIAEREHHLNEIVTWSGLNSIGRNDYLALNGQEVKELASEGSIEVGAHTVNHPVLSAISAEQQNEEIEQSKLNLESILSRPVNSFAYPFGTKIDYKQETVEIVKKNNFDCACSNFPDLVWKGSDRFQLPRFLVRNWSGEEFARRLQGWFDCAI
jgi:peptidoglycan/xylan/chitin deacetylase (PgdA/CDA1 family)